MADPILTNGNPPLDWEDDGSIGVIELISEDSAKFIAKTGRVIEYIP